MKVGIITLHNPPNYGAMLQAHGLCNTLLKLGHDAEIIDFKQPEVESYYRFKWSIPPRLNQWVRLRRARKFVYSRQVLSEKSYSSADEFAKDANQYDALICGSDQIWYTGPVHYYEPMYFLDIPGFKGRKISYAASVGGANDFGGFASAVTHAVKAINFVGVRDSHTESVVKNVVSTEMTRVMDPVFLHKYKEIISTESPMLEPYLLLFGNFPDSASNQIRELAKNKGTTKIVTLQYKNSAADRRVAAPSPEQWISYFKHAHCVLTSYFHGTVVSLKFQRDFISIPTPGRRSKVLTLLESVNCANRYIESLESQPTLAKVARSQIDWKQVSGAIQKRIDKSMDFLRTSLS
jgi:hypothetical protein